MPGDSHALTFAKCTELQSNDSIRHSGECKSSTTTPGNRFKINTTSTASKEKSGRIQVQPVELQSQTTLVERKIKSSVTCGGKTCKTRLSSSSCNQHGPRADNNSAVSKRKSLEMCTSCSSNDVIEVNIKLKSCQNCQNVVIDELNYDNQLVDGQDDSSGKRKISNSSIASTSGGGSLNFYHQQLIGITKKLKNMYKNRIHSSPCTDEQNMHPACPASSSSAITPTTIESVACAQGAATATKTCPSIDTKPVRIVTSQNLSTNFTNSIHNNHCYRNNLPTDHECSTSKTSSISTLPFKANSSSNSNVINKDALILRICDLDDKLKSIQNESNMSSNRTPSINEHNGEVASRTAKASKNIEGGKKSSPLPAQATQTSNRQIIVISNEYKNKSEQHDLFIRDRKQLMKIFQQKKSKSLDLLPPRKHSKISLHRNMQNHMFASQSVTNLSNKSIANKKGANNQNVEDDDDDDGPYESINSVELIFISDDFLNKAVKHDLKILKNKRTTTGNDSLRPTPSSSASSSFKKKVRTLDSTTSPIKMLRPDSYSSDNQQTPSPVSPDSHQSSSNRSASHRASLTSSKKLIVISEDFKRKSLENNVVIVDTCTSDTNSIGEAIDKRKKFQQVKRISRQQSSIDDVANQMMSHAFRSFEEPDKQCLESKELKTPE